MLVGDLAGKYLQMHFVLLSNSMAVSVITSVIWDLTKFVYPVLKDIQNV